MRRFAIVAVYFLGIVAGARTCGAVLGEKPVGSDGLVLGFFEGAPPTELRALVVQGGEHRFIEPMQTHRASLPPDATLVTSGEGKLQHGWARVVPTTIDGRAGFRLKGGFDDASWSCTYVVDGNEIRWISSASVGSMAPLLALFDGFIVATVVAVVGLFLVRLVPRARAR